MQFDLSIPATKTLGLQVGLRLIDTGAIYQAGIVVTTKAGYSQEMILILDCQTGKVQIQSGAAWTIYTFPSIPTVGMWVSLKGTMNLETHKYVRLNIGGQSYDLSSYTLEPPVPITPSCARVFISGMAQSALGVDSTGNLGYVILTSDDPP